MSMKAAELISIKNLDGHHLGWPSRRGGRAAFYTSSVSAAALGSSSSYSVKFQSIVRHRICRASPEAPPVGLGSATVALDFPSLLRRNSWNQSIVAFAASHEDSKHSEIEVEKGNDDVKVGVGAEESQEAWKQALDAFKEQALKMQSISQEAYETYSKKAMVILEETSVQLKIQADKARNDLSVLAKEISEEGKEYLSAAAEKYPEPIKEVVDTFSSSTDELNDFSKVKDFHLGIPYGLFLSLGGFLSFMFMGSISAIRFGVILGGALLALSVSSLRSQRKGQPYGLALKGQTAIAAIIFLRGLYLLSQRASILTFLDASTSGSMVAFYLYRTALWGNQIKGPDSEQKIN